MKRIVIIGAGPTGLGAAYRLRQLDYENFIVYEQNSYVGGLCASFKDNKGFTWDLGGHVIFSHYQYFDKLLETLLGDRFLEHKREAWIRTMNRWIPYPFQNNIKYLPEDVIAECLTGLEKLKRQTQKTVNFEEWIVNNLGEGIAKYFMFPYNFKVWAYPLHSLSADWIAERVSKVKLKDVTTHLESDINRTDWGPNAVFKYPLYGGTGEIFRKMAVSLHQKIKLNSKVTRIDAKHKKLYLANGGKESYDVLINSSPLDKFIKLIKNCKGELLCASLNLEHNGVFIVGIGINKPCPSNKCWMYFPNSNSPFFRVTYLSNYSPNNVPGNKEYYSLLCESAYSEHKREDKDEIVEKTIQGLINSGLIKEIDKKFIISRFLFDIEYAYPIPTLKRDGALRKIQPQLERIGIYSRGRFGAWKYEIGNTDHSVMQGKEIVDRILEKNNESVWKI